MGNTCWARGCENEVLVEYCTECLMTGFRDKIPTIENAFAYHAPKEGQPQKYTDIREKAKELAYLIADTVPEGRERSVAMTNLEQAVFWANAGIARN